MKYNADEILYACILTESLSQNSRKRDRWRRGNDDDIDNDSPTRKKRRFHIIFANDRGRHLNVKHRRYNTRRSVRRNVHNDFMRYLRFTSTQSPTLEVKQCPLDVGHRRLRLLQSYIINARDTPRGVFQIMVHKWLIKAILPYLYKECWGDKETIIRRKYMLTETLKFFLVKTARRMGKSEGIAMFAASVVLILRNFKVAIFAQNRDSARTLMRRVKAMIIRLLGLDNANHKLGRKIWNVDKIGIWHDDENDEENISSVSAFASTPESCKGQGFDLGIIDEAALVPMSVMLEGVVPMFTMKNAVACAISTPRSEDNSYSHLLNSTKDDGSPMHFVLDVELVCGVCKNKSTDSELNDACPHRKHIIPSWKSSEATEIIKSMYKRHPKLYKQEILGQIVSGEGRVFNMKFVKLLEERQPARMPNGEIPCIVIAFDPTGGSISDYGACAVYVDGLNLVVCGLMSEKLDSMNLNGDQIHTTERFIRGLLNLDGVGASTLFIVAIEANNNQVQANQIAGICMKELLDYRHVVLKDIAKNPGVYGVWKTQSNTEAMILQFNAYLSSGRVLFSLGLFVISNECNDDKESVKRMLYAQFSNYKRVPCYGKGGTVDIFKNKPTGKVDGNDDMLISVLWCTFYMQYYLRNTAKFVV